MKELPKIAKIFDYKMLFYDFVKLTGVPLLLFERTKKIYIGGKKPKKLLKGKIVIFANHPSLADPAILLTGFWKRRLCFLATKNIFKNKFVGALLRGMHTIPLDRENTGVGSFKKAQDILNRGHLIALFPEAHVTKQEDIQQFSSGAVLMAIISKADLLPVYIVKRKKWYNRQVLAIGNRIDYKKYVSGPVPTIDEINKITNILQQEEIKLKQYYEAWHERKHKTHEK